MSQSGSMSHRFGGPVFDSLPPEKQRLHREIHAFFEPWPLSEADLQAYGFYGMTAHAILQEPSLAEQFALKRSGKWRWIPVCNCSAEDNRHREIAYDFGHDEFIGSLRIHALKFLRDDNNVLDDGLGAHTLCATHRGVYLTQRGLRLPMDRQFESFLSPFDSAPYWAWKALSTGTERLDGGGRIALPEVLIRVVEQFVGWRPKNPLRSIPEIIRTLDETTAVGPSNEALWSLNAGLAETHRSMMDAQVVLCGSWLLHTTMRSAAPFGRGHMDATPDDIDLFCTREAFPNVLAVLEESTHHAASTVSGGNHAKVGRYDVFMVPDAWRYKGRWYDQDPFSTACAMDMPLLDGCIAFGYNNGCAQLVRFGMRNRRMIEDGVMWSDPEDEPCGLRNTEARVAKYERRGFRRGPSRTAPAPEALTSTRGGRRVRDRERVGAQLEFGLTKEAQKHRRAFKRHVGLHYVHGHW